MHLTLLFTLPSLTLSLSLPLPNSCSPKQRTATVQVIIPPGVDDGDSSYPLVSRLRKAMKFKKPQRWVTCLGFKCYETDVIEEAHMATVSGSGGGTGGSPQRLAMDPALRARFKEMQEERDGEELEAKKEGKGTPSPPRRSKARREVDPDDRWL